MKKIGAFMLAVVIIVSFCSPLADVKAMSLEDAYGYAKAKIASAMANKEESVDISEFTLSPDYAAQLYYDVIYSNPLFYYVDTQYSEDMCIIAEASDFADEHIASYTIDYVLSDTEETDEILEEHIAAAESEIVKSGMHAVDIMISIHEYIVSNVDKIDRVEEPTEDMLYSTAYGALVYGCADSVGYSLLNKLLSERITGNECIVVADSNRTLYWNMYCLSGKWYNIDVYSDDAEQYYYDTQNLLTNVYSVGGNVLHTNLLVINSDFNASGHSLGEAFRYEGTPDASVDAIKIRIWDNIMSKMCYYDGYWHYVSPENPDTIVKRLTSVIVDASTEIAVVYSDEPIIAFTMTDDSIYFASSDNTVHKRTAEGLDDVLIYTADDTAVLIGLGDRFGSVFIETYDRAAWCGFYTNTEIIEAGQQSVYIDNGIVCGIYIGTDVKDFICELYMQNYISKYDALNNVCVYSDSILTDESVRMTTGMTVQLPDGSSYTAAVYGDVKADGRMNILDVMSVLSYTISDSYELTAAELTSADYNSDGAVNIADAAEIMSGVLGK